MNRLTRDETTAETVSRDQIFRRERRQGKKLTFPVQLTPSRIGNLTWLTLTLAIYKTTIHTYIHTIGLGLERYRLWPNDFFVHDYELDGHQEKHYYYILAHTSNHKQ